ncbi:MAG: M48 family metallopeptidase [Alphaproteobacteria bacterium]|nr:M48 family metallopeptidase [Alphaproteobacteria bacterium]
MASGAVGLQTHIWRNNTRSIMLIALYPFLMLGLVWIVGALVGGVFYAGTVEPAVALDRAMSFGNGIVLTYWPLVMAAVGAWFLVAYFFQARMLRSLSHARPVRRTEEPALYNLLENLCIAQGMTMPRLEIIETPARNAYASGIDRRSYTVTVTRGLLDALGKDEIEAVLAHELTHIINRDVRLLIVSIIFTGMIGFLAQLIGSSLRHGLYHQGGRGGRQGDGRLFLLMMAVWAVLWLGYLATVFTRFALSRRREFMADAGAVEMTKNPAAMMRALLRIAEQDRIPDTPDDIALMCTANSRKFLGLFATHPPIDQRVQVLSAVTGTPTPALSPWSRSGRKTEERS